MIDKDVGIIAVIRHSLVFLALWEVQCRRRIDIVSVLYYLWY